MRGGIVIMMLALCLSAHAEDNLHGIAMDRAHKPSTLQQTNLDDTTVLKVDRAMLPSARAISRPTPFLPRAQSLQCIRHQAPFSVPLSPQETQLALQAKPLRGRRIATNACYPGTDIEIKTEGVTFPIVAKIEVGEAGKTCTGEETTTGVTGMMTMTQTDAENCIIEYEVKGLVAGKHGFHIHEKADFSNGCASAGPHFNPFKATHGGPDMEVRHVGDLGNIEPGPDGVAKGTIKDKFVKLFGEYTVVGRSIMIHADPDDLGEGPLEGWPEKPPPPAPAQHTKTTGNAGARIACGVIKIP